MVEFLLIAAAIWYVGRIGYKKGYDTAMSEVQTKRLESALASLEGIETELGLKPTSTVADLEEARARIHEVT